MQYCGQLFIANISNFQCFSIGLNNADCTALSNVATTLYYRASFTATCAVHGSACSKLQFRSGHSTASVFIPLLFGM